MISLWEKLENRELLSHGVEWVERVPYFRVVDVSSVTSHLLPISNQSIGLKITSDAKHCVGRYAMDGQTSIALRICPNQGFASSSGQCEHCAAVDEFRFAHHAHRGSYSPRNLERYLSQPHWLYLATFADGTSKVGTASEARKVARVDEQGAFVVTYVAQTQDGWRIRSMEDSVSTKLGLTQRVSRSTKLHALASPEPINQLKRVHDKLVDEIVTSLGLTTTTEPWTPPDDFMTVMQDGDRDRYGASMKRGEHGFFIEGCAGPFVLARLRSNSNVSVVADLNETKGLRLELGEFRSQVQAVQAGLF